MIFGLFIWAQAFGLYLLLAAEIDTDALLAAGPAALAAAALGAALKRGARGQRLSVKRTRNPLGAGLHLHAP